MAENTKIEWARHTWSPWIGCQKVSPACDNCYAEALNKRAGGGNWGPGAPRRRTSEAYWKQLPKWNRQAIAAGERPFVFPSMCDPFDNAVDPSWRRDFFDAMRAAPQLVFLLLTKRIGNAIDMTDAAGGWPPNAAAGITVINQAEYDRDRLKLHALKVLRPQPLFTFGSFEPLLGPIIIDRFAPDWIIVGGESGPKAREMDADWARSIQDQCARHERLFFMKQMSRRAAIPADLMVREVPLRAKEGR